MCIYCNSFTYMLPENYHPNINSENFDREVAKVMHRNCITIDEKDNYYCNSKGQLKGFHWINFPMRIWKWIKNWITDGKIDKDVIKKVTETFNFILNINTHYPIHPYIDGQDVEDSERCFHNTSFMKTIKFFATYTNLAKKIMEKYKSVQNPELFNLSHRILHERQLWIAKKVTQIVDGRMQEVSVDSRNIRDEAMDTPYEATTVWNYR